jgi:3-oxoacyl-[acyl-carrier protein] reductase
MDLELTDRVALVAGGSRGTGRAVALALAREGAHVAVLARDDARTQEVAEAVRAAGRRAEAVVVDVTRPEALLPALDAVKATMGVPTIVVLAIAAVYAPSKLAFVSNDDARRLLETDLYAHITLCRWALPGMLEARFGRIVALGSLAARTGVAGGTLYATAKAGLEGLVRGIAVDYSRHGITANALSLGFVDTERLAFRLGDDEAARERLERMTAARRLPRPEDVAEVVAFLCSPRASAITGSVVEVTAGAHLNSAV